MTLGKGKIWKQDKNNLLLNDYVIKNNAGVIILITWLMLAFFLNSNKDVFYQVSSDLSEVNGFYSSFSDKGQKASLPFKSSKMLALISYWWSCRLCICGFYKIESLCWFFLVKSYNMEQFFDKNAFLQNTFHLSLLTLS